MASMEPREASARAEAPGGFRWHLFGRYLAGFLAVALVIGIVVGLVAARRPLDRRAGEVLSSAAVSVRFVWPTVASAQGAAPMTWMPRERQVELLGEAAERLRRYRDPLDPRALQDLSGWLGSSGWFEGVPTVRRDGDGSVVVAGDWRTPVAVVRRDEKEYWISASARVMPALYPPGQTPVRAIVSPSRGVPLAGAGQVDYASPWEGEDVRAGMELLALLSRQKWYGQVAGVDVSGHAGSGSLSILTRHGTELVWGGRPSSPRYGDSTTSEKLRNIDTLFADTRRIDAGYPKVYINSQYLLFDRRLAEQVLAERSGVRPAGSTVTRGPERAGSVDPAGSRPANR